MDSATPLRDLVEPFSTAMLTTLQEMARTEAVVLKAVYGPMATSGEDLAASLALAGSLDGQVMLTCPPAVAAVLAERILAESSVVPNEELIRDCLGEIGNVVSGQAKAILSGTRFAFRFSTPIVRTLGEHPAAPAEGFDKLTITIATDAGEIALRLHLRFA